MIIEQPKTEVIGSTAKKTNAFNIQVNDNAFAILSDKLYQDKELAIVREYISNAYDIHVLTGNLVPCEINIPDKINPNFEVRDFGTGLSEEDIYRLFCTYFASNKNETNEQIGGFGLGCKSGFAYSGSFSVTSWFNGVKTNYIMTKMGNVPTCITGKSYLSDEPSGLKISIPTDNYFRFTRLVPDVLDGFPRWFIPPQIRSNLHAESLVERYLKKNKDFNTEGGYIIYGNFKLRNPLNLLAHENSFTGTHFNISSYYQGNLCFNVGEIDVTPSREQIELTDKTRKAIENRKQEFIDILAKLDEQTKNMPMREAYLHFKEFFKKSSQIVFNLPYYQIKYKKDDSPYSIVDFNFVFKADPDIPIFVGRVCSRKYKKYFVLNCTSNQYSELKAKLESFGLTNVIVPSTRNRKDTIYEISVIEPKAKQISTLTVTATDISEKRNYVYFTTNKKLFEKLLPYSDYLRQPVWYVEDLPQSVRKNISENSVSRILPRLACEINTNCKVRLYSLCVLYENLGLKEFFKKKPELVFEEYVSRMYIGQLRSVIEKNRAAFLILGYCLNDLDDLLGNYNQLPTPTKNLVKKDIKTLTKLILRYIETSQQL